MCVCPSQMDAASRSPFMQKQPLLYARLALSPSSSAGSVTLCVTQQEEKINSKLATEISRFLHRFHLFSAKASGDQLGVIGPTDSFIVLNQSWWEENNCVQSASSHLLISSSFPLQKARSYYTAETPTPAAATQRCDLLAQRRKKGP